MLSLFEGLQPLMQICLPCHAQCVFYTLGQVVLSGNVYQSRRHPRYMPDIGVLDLCAVKANFSV